MGMGSRQLRLNVRDLIGPAETQPQDDWSWTAATRARAGSELHARLLERRQTARPADRYRKEVWLSETFGYREFEITLQGRLDGMYATDRGWLVEEIKSVVLRSDDLDLCELQAAHREQCGFYCLLLARGGEAVAGGEVIYASVRDESERAISIEWEPDYFEALLEERLERIVARLLRDEAFASWRERTAGRLRLPFEKPRPDQALMLRDVEGVARDGLNLLCSAPTGTGKTAGALLPVAREALLSDGRLFFVTSRISQQELALETLRSLVASETDGPASGDSPSGADASACGLGMQLRAKERSCPLEVMRCIDGVCPYITDYAVRLEQSDIVNRLAQEGVVDADRITEAAVAETLCPFEVSLALAGRSTVIVADYNYVFDPRVYLRRFLDGRVDAQRGKRRFLIVDEAHNLPDRARAYYSPELDVNIIESLIADLQALAIAPLGYARPERDVFFRASLLLQEFVDIFYAGLREFEEEQGESPFYVERPGKLYEKNEAGRDAGEQLEERIARIQELIAMYFAWLAGDSGGADPQSAARDSLPFRMLEGRRYRDVLLDTLYACLDFCRSLTADPELFAYVWHGEKKLWQAVCRDPAPFLERRLSASFYAVLAMSATLTPFDFFARQLGLRDALHLDLRGGFSPSNRRIIACTGVDTRFRTRSASVPEIARIMAGAMIERPGNYLAFFPSFAFRDEVAAVLPDAFEGAGELAPRLIHQTPAMPAGIVMRMLRQPGAAGKLLLAVHGGVFAEGVDFPGELAVGAFIVGPGLPQISIERQLIREYFDGRDLDGFDYSLVHPGINRSVQAAGRVIRTERDRGVILLLGARFAEERYFEKLPAAWREELRIAPDYETTIDLVRKFWRGFK
ncbi:MAG: ATP-dependent DNA helicase [Leptospirales bacterium]